MDISPVYHQTDFSFQQHFRLLENVNGRREKAYLFGPGSAPMKIGEHD
jgi:hypothetical protein